VCDNCPNIPNPTQDPEACVQHIVNAQLQFVKSEALVSWQTTTETNTIGFNVVKYVKGQRIQLNTAVIPCQHCADGRAGSYSVFVGKHKSGQNVFVELIIVGGIIQESVPAPRN
jgi:threonine dehydrogenase-like Zn-dependent dehydrogenase